VSGKAVILAAGRGSRMRYSSGAGLTEDQRAMAELGLKGLIPFEGHAFLEYVLTAVADAGLDEVCVVVRPGEDPIRSALAALPTRRLRLSFVVQEVPRGSADALLKAEGFAGVDPFVLINADNYYPPAALRAVAGLPESGLAGFREETLVDQGGIPGERVASYALAVANDDGLLTDIVEKPDAATMQAMRPHAWVSMTCWRFRPIIFQACRTIGPSSRGELELPDAVRLAVSRFGEPFRVIPVEEPVLDLAQQSDVPIVASRLKGLRVSL
jgi:dTDP-glucose pyrophosphorylase